MNSTKSNRVKNRLSAPSAHPWPARAPRPCSQRLCLARVTRLTQACAPAAATSARLQACPASAYRARPALPNACAPLPPPPHAPQRPARLCPCRAPYLLPREPAAPACVPRPPKVISWPDWPCRGPVSRHSPAALLPQSRYKILYRDTLPSSLPAIQSCVLQYNSTFPTIKPSSLQYNNCIAIQFSVYPMLQYNFQPAIHFLYCNTLLFTVKIQYILLQHKFSFSQYNLGSSPKTVFALHFFFLCSSHWKITKHIYLFYFYFFIFHNTQINF